MKILYHHRVASKDGQYVHIEEIISSLRELGHEVIVCEPDSIKKTSFGSGSGLVQRIRSVLPGVLHEFAEFLYSLSDYRKLRRLVKQHQPDCIYERYNLYFISGIWARKKFNLPVIVEVNAPLFMERSENDGISLPGLAQWSEDYVWQNADWVLPVTEVLADYVRSRGVSGDKIEVIPNGINKKFTERLSAAELHVTSGRNDGLILGFTGFVREWHRLDRVLNVIARNRKSGWQLLLVGDGPARASLEAHASELGISDRLTITGIVSREDIPAYVKQFDIALQPDVVSYASPLKIFEYMALAKPILAPDVANIREILKDEENALLFTQTDDAFSEKLTRLCLDEALRSDLGARARATLDEKDLYWDCNAQKIVALFRQSIIERSHITSEIPG